MDNEEMNEAQADSAADSTLESEIDALSKILEESKDDQSGPVDDHAASFDDLDDTGNDNDFFSFIDSEKSLTISDDPDQKKEKSEKDEEEEKVAEKPNKPEEKVVSTEVAISETLVSEDKETEKLLDESEVTKEIKSEDKDTLDEAGVMETEEIESVPVKKSETIEQKSTVSEEDQGATIVETLEAEEEKMESLEMPEKEVQERTDEKEIKKIEDEKTEDTKIDDEETEDEKIKDEKTEELKVTFEAKEEETKESKNESGEFPSKESAKERPEAVIEMATLELTEDEKSPEPAELEGKSELSGSKLDNEGDEKVTLMEGYVTTVESSEMRVTSPTEDTKTDDEVFHTPPQSVHEDEDLKESDDKKEEEEKFEDDPDLTLSYEEDEKETERTIKPSQEVPMVEDQSLGEEKNVMETEEGEEKEKEREEPVTIEKTVEEYREEAVEEENVPEEKIVTEMETEAETEEMKLVVEKESEADSEIEAKSEDLEPTKEPELKEETVVQCSQDEPMEIDCSLDEVVKESEVQKAEEIVEKSEETVIQTEETFEKAEETFEKAEETFEKAEEMSEKVEEIYEKAEEISEKAEEIVMKVAETFIEPDDAEAKLVEEIEEEKMELGETEPESCEEITVAVENKLDPEESETEVKESSEIVPSEQLEIEKEDEGPDLNLTLEPESEYEQGDDEVQTATENIPKDPNPVDSELEFAVKFLQDAEEQSIEADSTIIQKETSVPPESREMTNLFVSVQSTGLCENAPDMESELEESTPDPIAISEAEIISEAAKLESEKKAKLDEEKQIQENEASSTFEEERLEFSASDGLLTVARHDCPPVQIPVEAPKLPTIVPTTSENVPQISVLEERLKEPPQIEIPNSSCDILSLTPKSSLLMPRDSKGSNTTQKSLESPRKEEGDNVGSPRIILKIAKSALADCSEPRSPKSPKIRSATNSPNPEDSPGQKLGKIKLKLSRGGHPSIISNDNVEESAPTQWHADSSTSSLSPLGVKIKLSKSGDASVVQPDKSYDFAEDREKHKVDEGKKVDTPSSIGMKIKLSKSGDASVVQSDVKEDDHRKNETPIGMKIKLSKSGDAEIIHDKSEDTAKRTESPIGMKIKLSKYGDPSIIQSEDHKKERQDDIPKRTESPIGVKIKLSKTGDASIVEDIVPKENELKRTESPIGMKIKLSKSGDASIVHPDKSEYLEQESKKDRDIPKRTESPIGMKIKLSKSGDASIIPQDGSEDAQRDRHDEPVKLKLKTMTPDREILKKDRSEMRERRHKSKEPEGSLEMKIKLSKSGHATIVHNEPLEEEKEYSEDEEQNQGIPKMMMDPLQMMKQDLGSKRKELTISPVDPKKSKLDAKLSLIPEIKIQDAQKVAVDVHSDQSKLLSHNISITNVRSIADDMSLQESVPTGESSMSEKLKSLLVKQSMPSPSGSDCEIIEHRPELILVNENSNSSQDVMIIDEVPVLKPLEIKVPKKRGRPRRNPLPTSGPVGHMQLAMRDPLALDDLQPGHQSSEQKESERPRRTCRSQKSYAPPKRGRGRGGGRGKRKMDGMAMISPNKRTRIDQDLTLIEERTTGIINLDDSEKPKELIPIEGIEIIGTKMPTPKKSKLAAKAARALQRKAMQEQKALELRRAEEAAKEEANKHPNWLTPLSKKAPQDKESSAISTVQVIDEETRMSAESGSRSQTPARNLAAPGVSENILNEESQGSVLSTATTESEKVKVKNRRMEINFDPDEGPFTVDKIAEYEWPQDRKGETFMIQEQISQYLGVKSFKRKYPDLKRRMVDMEERNFLRENGLVSEAMCDMGMGLTAICSSEVLDVMCSDFPEQYEEYRKQMRERQVKEHSKKQKELSAAANAERNRIDLAEMAVQSALSWNAKLNKSRKDTRKCSLDLQTFTIHVPQKKSVKIDPNRKISYYPVALIPGQYTDYYREYTPAELRYYPLNTVLYGPMKPNERKFDSQSEGSQSDSDSESSSDDSSSTSSEGTQDTEESQSTMEEVDMELAVYKEDSKNIKCKMCLKYLNKYNKTEVLIQCGTCNGHVHPSCIDLTLDMVPHLQAYAWQCTDCKTCAQCHDPADEDKMLFCDMCDRGYHIYCVGLRRVPQGRWHCQECAVCANCGTKEPAGVNAERNSVAQWQHEYKKGDKNIRVYVSTLCVPCSKLWRKGRYCPHCSRCHTAQRLDLETNLVHCSACDKYLHLDCVEIKSGHLDRKNFLCDFCTPSRNSMPKSVLSKTVKSF